MLKSDSTTEIIKALVAAQQEINGALKDRKNTHFGNSYADLTSVFEACKAPLNKQGIAIVQTTDQAPDGIVLVTSYLMHTSGQHIGCQLTLRPLKNDPQGIGSAITYARRYTLMALAGVCPEDDDGNEASAKPSALPRTAVHDYAERTMAEVRHTNTSVGLPVAAIVGPYTAPELTHKQRYEIVMAELTKAIGKEKADAKLAEFKTANGGAKTIPQKLAVLQALEAELALYPVKEA